MTEASHADLILMTVPLTASVREALEAIDHSGCEIALVVDQRGRLAGVLTDGDLRRPLLKGAGLDDDVAPFVTREPVVVAPEVGRAEVLDLMTARGIEQVPITNQNGGLVGLHVMRDLLGRVERPNWAVIMAGGRGARLAPLTDEVPKPMLPVAGRPILERLVLHLVGAGIRRIFVAVNYKAEAIEAHFRDGHEFGCRVEYLREEHPLGTGGALSLLPQGDELPEAPVLVMNGDLVTQVAVNEMVRHHEQGEADATVAVREYHHEVPFGVVELDDHHRIREIVEKPTVSWAVNAGIYVLEPRLLPLVPSERSYEMTELIADCLASGGRVQSWRVQDEWHDVGRPDELRRARGEL